LTWLENKYIQLPLWASTRHVTLLAADGALKAAIAIYA
jgi:hypothetical protein